VGEEEIHQPGCIPLSREEGKKNLSSPISQKENVNSAEILYHVMKRKGERVVKILRGRKRRNRLLSLILHSLHEGGRGE